MGRILSLRQTDVMAQPWIDFEMCLVWFRPHYNLDGSVRFGDYVEVVCEDHDYACGHHHRQWGPLMRCATQHQEATK